jgi:hypothetical protein
MMMSNTFLMSLIKIRTPVLKISTYIFTSITAPSVRLALILAIMSVSTFKTDVILYFFYIYCKAGYFIIVIL